MAESPDLSETLPAPTPLCRTAIISFVCRAQVFHVGCVAACVRRAHDPETRRDIDWVHCQGSQWRSDDPTGRASTTFYLIPVSHVIRITHGGLYRIVERKKSDDLGIFPPTDPTPDAALPPSDVRDIIQRLQIQEGREAPLLYDNFVRDVSERFEQALALIKSEHNFELGTEFEIAICQTLRIVLPQKYGICRGYVVSALGEKAGDDIVIYDRMRFPTLRALESDDFSRKEHVPIEAVYAYIEAKHSISIEGRGGGSLQKALSQVARVKILCERRTPVSIGVQERSSQGAAFGWPAIRNPAYGVILARHVRLEDGGSIIENPQEIRSHLIAARAQTLLAPDFCVFGKNNMFIPVISAAEPDTSWTPSPFYLDGQSSMHSSIVDGLGFGAGLSFLLWALDWIQLGEMAWPHILEECIRPVEAPGRPSPQPDA
jgi:hypothetical protein